MQLMIVFHLLSYDIFIFKYHDKNDSCNNRLKFFTIANFLIRLSVIFDWWHY